MLEGERAAWCGSILVFQQVLALGLFGFKNQNKSTASLGSDAKAGEMGFVGLWLVGVSGLLKSGRKTGRVK